MTVLHADGTDILKNVVGLRERATGLRELYARASYRCRLPRDIGMRFTRWDAFAHKFCELRVLHVSCWAIEDEGVSDALGALPLLEVLGMWGCSLAGDKTAFAVTRHPALRVVDLRLSSVGPAGKLALRRWKRVYRHGYRKAYLKEATTQPAAGVGRNKQWGGHKRHRGV